MTNFGLLKNSFNNLMLESLFTKDLKKKKLFQQYVRIIKENEILKTQFLIYTNIENRCDTDYMSANLFITENLKLLDKFNKKHIINENTKLFNLLDKTLINEGEYINSNIHKALSNLIITKRSPENIESITEDIKVVIDYILTNKHKVVNEHIDLPNSLLLNLMVDKFNGKYETLNESDKKFLKLFTNTDSKVQKSNYIELVNECTDIINTLLLSESDEESKNKLTLVKAKLNEVDELTEDNFINKVSKLAVLKANLIN